MLLLLLLLLLLLFLGWYKLLGLVNVVVVIEENIYLFVIVGVMYQC